MKITSFAYLLLAACQAQSVDWVSQVANKPALDTREFNFARQNGAGVSGDLSVAGPQALLLTPCPRGLSGSNTKHHLTVIGGTGPKEVVLVTGGTCVSGAASGTITFTTTAPHLGGWLLRSASSGLQETIWAAGGVARITLPPGNIGYDGTVTVPGNSCVSIRGQGIDATVLVADFTAGDLLVFDSGGSCGYFDVGDFWINQSGGTPTHTSGAFLTVKWRPVGVASNINMDNCWDCLVIERSGAAHYSTMKLSAVNNAIDITCHGMTLADGCSNELQMDNIHTTSRTGTNISISGTTTGIILDSIFTEGGLHSLWINQPTDAPVNEIIVSNAILDGPSGDAVLITGNGRAFINNTIQLSNSRITTSGSGRALVASGKMNGLRIIGNEIAANGAGTNAVMLSDIQGSQLSDNKISSNGAVALSIAGTNQNVYVTNNVIGFNPDSGSAGAGAASVGVSVSGSQTRTVVSGNNLFGSTSALLSTAFGTLYTFNNVGVDVGGFNRFIPRKATGNAGSSITITVSCGKLTFLNGILVDHGTCQ